MRVRRSDEPGSTTKQSELLSPYTGRLAGASDVEDCMRGSDGVVTVPLGDMVEGGELLGAHGVPGPAVRMVEEGTAAVVVEHAVHRVRLMVARPGPPTGSR